MQTAFDLSPFGSGEDPRQQIVGKYPLNARVIAVYGESDPLVKKGEIGVALTLLQFICAEATQAMSQFNIRRANAAIRSEHLVVGGGEGVALKRRLTEEGLRSFQAFLFI